MTRAEPAPAPDSAAPAQSAPNQTRAWRPTLWAASVCGAALVVAYFETYRSMVQTWQRSETFAHGFVVLPIVIWLVWRKRRELSLLTPVPALWGLPFVAVFSLGWLGGWAANVLAVQQLSAVLLVPALLLTLAGTTVTRALAFPLAFLMFAVPVGELLVPVLTDYTARVTVAGLQLFGVPVSKEGLYFKVPGGNWEISKACSGIRYLMASVAVGALFAHLNFRTRRRKLEFLALSVVVPIAANWVRAFLIVMTGYLSDMKLATGVDHIIYGWLFFSFITLGLCWLGSRWREPDAPAAPAVPTPFPVPVSAPARGWIGAWAGATALTLLLAPATAAYLDRLATRVPPRSAVLAPEAGSSWSGPSETSDTWQPVFVEPEQQVRCVYRKGGHKVQYFAAFYGDQRVGSELINSVNRIYDRKTWKPVAGGPRTEHPSGRPLPITETSLHLESSNQAQRRLVWHWYVVDGVPTTNPYFAKVLEARAKLQGKPRRGVVIAIAADYDSRPEEARSILLEFLEDHHAALEGESSRVGARAV